MKKKVVRVANYCFEKARPRAYNTFFMLNSAEAPCL